jgi:hypothetical protein
VAAIAGPRPRCAFEAKTDDDLALKDRFAPLLSLTENSTP